MKGRHPTTRDMFLENKTVDNPNLKHLIIWIIIKTLYLVLIEVQEVLIYFFYSLIWYMDRF